MLLIADSGSTKCDWLLFKNNEIEPIRILTKGLNPSILKGEEIKKIISRDEILFGYAKEITSIYFFGAGCSTPKSIKLIEDALSSFFEKATIIAKEDTMAAVWATTKKPAVVCILGTGSNCCYYDGVNIHLKVPAMGYLLMDEASGNYFGKELLKSYYYNQMPDDLRDSFANKFSLNENKVLDNLYKSKTPNRYLADYAVFLIENKGHDFIDKIIRDGISKFVDNHILQFSEELKTVPLHFVGSISYYLKDYIILILKERGFNASRFVKRPIDNLIHIIKEENVNAKFKDN